MEQKRAVGVILFGIGEMLIGLFALRWFFSFQKLSKVSYDPAPLAAEISFLFLILFFGYIMIGVFVLKQEEWARKLSIFLVPSAIVFANNETLALAAIGFFSIANFFYLTRAKVKEQFKKREL
ncbi:MAG: hypothetical protein WC628_00560 [Candidatus Omnitrophota bacterium]